MLPGSTSAACIGIFDSRIRDQGLSRQRRAQPAPPARSTTGANELERLMQILSPEKARPSSQGGSQGSQQAKEAGARKEPSQLNGMLSRFSIAGLTGRGAAPAAAATQRAVTEANTSNAQDALLMREDTEVRTLALKCARLITVNDASSLLLLTPYFTLLQDLLEAAAEIEAEDMPNGGSEEDLASHVERLNGFLENMPDQPAVSSQQDFQLPGALAKSLLSLLHIIHTVSNTWVGHSTWKAKELIGIQRAMGLRSSTYLRC